MAASARHFPAAVEFRRPGTTRAASRHDLAVVPSSPPVHPWSSFLACQPSQVGQNRTNTIVTMVANGHEPANGKPPEKRMRFLLGEVVATPGALGMLAPAELQDALLRHVTGDWGDVDQEDRQANEQALADGSRLMSAYKSAQGKPFWVITESDRSVTTLLLPEEY